VNPLDAGDDRDDESGGAQVGEDKDDEGMPWQQ